MGKFYTLKQACELLQLKESALYRMTSENRIEFYKIAGKIRFSEEQLKNFLENCRQPTIEEEVAKLEASLGR